MALQLKLLVQSFLVALLLCCAVAELGLGDAGDDGHISDNDVPKEQPMLPVVGNNIKRQVLAGGQGNNGLGGQGVRHNDNSGKMFGPRNPELAGVARDGGPIVPKKKKRTQMHLAETKECADDVHRFCSEHAEGNNFVILDCLQNDEKTHNKVTDECQHFLWTFKRNLTLNDGFDRASNRDCGPELAKFQDCKTLDVGKGLRIPCLMEHYDDVTSKSCKTFLNKMGSIIFSDYRYLHDFMTRCAEDLEALKCGRSERDLEDDAPHSQGKTLECMNKRRKEISNKPCKHALRRVNEMTSDDFHFDRPLYYACKGDREVFCRDTKAGDGAVYSCLMQNIGEKRMSEDCRGQLELRQQEISEDVKADKAFYDSCKADITKHRCGVRNADTGDDMEDDLSRSTVLLCLENAEADGKKVHPECLKQMFQLRSVLMQDYKVSPELVSACDSEIHQYCDGLEPDGETIECLMEEIVKEKKDSEIRPECKAQVSKLLKVANVGEDIRLDRPLQRACGDVVVAACANRRAGGGDIITCLLENLDHEAMTDECEDHLLIIQYFAVRDFKLDRHLFMACKKEATELCHNTGFENYKTMSPESGPLVFACLHTHLRSKDPADPKLSKPCGHEVRRVLRERSSRVKLMPKVEDACIQDLSDFCSDDEEPSVKGGEMECLQTNLENLSDECAKMVSAFTEEESENLELDRILMKACTPMITKFCKDELEGDALPTDVLECLIDYKNSYGMDIKCAAGIEHHQLISLKDFRFNHKFRKNCQEAVSTLCKNKNTKYDVVACLSEHVRNDTLMSQDHRVSRECRKELRFELLQRGESINLDPELKKECKSDVASFCKNVSPGKGEVIECLKSHKKKLSPKCHKMIFKREQDENMNGDYVLLHTCKRMIKQYCKRDGDEEEIFDCLKTHKNDNDFDEGCRKIVMRRQVEQTHDYRLNPHLQKACRMDIPKFCAEVFEHRRPGDTEMEGKIINCLKKQYSNKKKSLSKDCEYEIKSRIKEASLDINQNPVVVKVCKRDIQNMCLDKIMNVQQMKMDDSDVDIQTYGQGTVVECLKKNLAKIKDIACKREIALMLAASRVDIHVDPLLHSSCQQDLISLCRQVQQGQGRQMSCLLSYLDTDPDSLSRGCRGMLSGRKDLWEYAAQVAPPENFMEFAEQINASPARNYFLAVMFTAVGLILIIGITCGRVTKRVRAEVKNR